MPVSLRFRTSAPEIYFRLLAMQLAHIANERLGRPGTEPVAYYADECRELLNRLASSGKKVLIVLDGLDEGLSPRSFASIFPKSLPKTMRILISARLLTGDYDVTGWLNRLEWSINEQHHLVLPLLTPNQIADVFIQMGAPVDIVAQEPNLITRIAELTEGDPFLVRLYAQDLWRKGRDSAAISEADLDSLKPGFAPYFDRWLELQEEQWTTAGRQFDIGNIDRVLAVLAGAKGPLPGEDLLALFKYTFPDVLCPATSRILLEPLRRFVLGDGGRAPYVLGHPKIGQVLREERCRELMATVKSGFSAWGWHHIDALNQGHLTPEGASVYALQYLRHHFEETNAPAEMFMRFVEDGWRRAAEHIEEKGPGGFSTDVEAARTALRRNGEVDYLADQWRCALTLSSIKSPGHSVPGRLVVEAVKKGSLSIKQGQYYADLILDTGDGAETLIELAFLSISSHALCIELMHASSERAQSEPSSIDLEKLFGRFGDIVGAAATSSQNDANKSIISHALQASIAMAEIDFRCRALALITPHLPQECLDQALDFISGVSGEWYRYEAVAALAPRLSEAQASRALDIANAINEEWPHVHALCAVIPRLSGELLDKVLAIAERVSEKPRVQTLCVLVPRLPPKRIADVIGIAKGISEVGLRCDVLAALAPRLRREERQKELLTALVDIGAVHDAGSRCHAISALAPCLLPSTFDQALELVKEIDSTYYRSEALLALAPRLPTPLLPKAFAIAETLDDEQHRSHTLVTLAPRLPQPLLKRALEAARAITDEGHCFWVLFSLAKRLPQKSQRNTLADALLAAESISYDARDRFHAFFHLSELWPINERENILDLALAAANSIGRPNYGSLMYPQDPGITYSDALRVLAPRLTDQMFRKTLAFAAGDEGWRLRDCVRALATHLHGALLAEAFQAVKTIEPLWERSEALAALRSHVPLDEWCEAAEEIFGAVSDTDAEHYCHALGSLAPHLTSELLGKALASLKSISDGNHRAEALEELAPHLSDEKFLRKALEIVGKIGEETRRGLLSLWGLGEQQPIFFDDELKDAFAEAAIGIEKSPRARALEALAPQLSPVLMGDALAAATAISDEKHKCRAFNALAAHMPRPEKLSILKEAREAADAVDDGWGRSSCLIAIAAHLPRKQKIEVLREALVAVQTIGTETFRFGAFADLFPHLPRELLGEALEAASVMSDEEDRSRSIATLVPYLPPELHERAFAAVDVSMTRGDPADVLAALVPHITEELISKAINALGSLDEPARAEAIVSLASRLPRSLLNEALAVAENISDEWRRSQAVAALVPHLPNNQRTEKLEMLKIACDKQHYFDAVEKLAAIVEPAEKENLLNDVFVVAQTIGSRQYRGSALRVLANYLDSIT